MRLGSSDIRVHAGSARSGKRKQQEEEAVENRELAAVADRQEAVREMHDEEGDGHFSAKDESYGASEQTKEQQGSANQFKAAGYAQHGGELHFVPAHPSEHPKEFLQSVAEKGEARNQAQQA